MINSIEAFGFKVTNIQLRFKRRLLYKQQKIEYLMWLWNNELNAYIKDLQGSRIRDDKEM